MYSINSRSQMNHQKQPVRCASLLAGLALAGLALSPVARAAQLTYEMRAVMDGVLNGDHTTAGTVIANGGHSVTPAGPGSVVVLQLYAIVTGVDLDHTNDAFLQTFRSFEAVGSLEGSLRGDTNFVVNGQTTQNNVPGFLGTGSQSGFVKDLDGDVAIDVGDLSNHAGATNPAPWFSAVGGNGSSIAAVPGVGSGSVNTEFMIGELTFTLAPDAQLGPLTAVNFRRREWTSGLGSSYNKFTVDGVVKTLNWADANVAVGAAVNISLVPEPTAFGMLLLGTLGLVGFRRSAFRRLAA